MAGFSGTSVGYMRGIKFAENNLARIKHKDINIAGNFDSLMMLN